MTYKNTILLVIQNTTFKNAINSNWVYGKLEFKLTKILDYVQKTNVVNNNKTFFSIFKGRCILLINKKNFQPKNIKKIIFLT